ncbi:1,5-anhydro-D-fructose reductase-like [Uranotaenia lowii]|uniref:1,5-anhydro-D-fructose reductase-like n=1 Tax=Uranotaenia lowii TaxID=190385 RepID=UPI00247A04D7|nr:1,5-anhydro-D-fructose reductase-like [Uranotaenia lowii]
MQQNSSMDKIAPTVTLNNGKQMPILGLGTWMLRGGEAVETIKFAIDAGYRHFDTACYYRNEVEVGQAIRAKIAEGVIRREDVFVTTKLLNSHHNPAHVEEAFQRSYDKLNIGYIDLYLMHSPFNFEFQSWEPQDLDANPKLASVDFVDTWRAMEKLLQTGKVRSLGVSNFNSEQLTRIVNECQVKPVTNQVECNPAINQRRLTAFCKDLNVTVTAYTPFGQLNDAKENAINDPRVAEIASKYSKTPTQIVLRYLVELGTIPIPKSANPKRIRENLEIFDFRLTEAEIQLMDSFNTGVRVWPFTFCVSSKYYPFNIEF